MPVSTGASPAQSAQTIAVSHDNGFSLEFESREKDDSANIENAVENEKEIVNEKSTEQKSVKEIREEKKKDIENNEEVNEILQMYWVDADTGDKIETLAANQKARLQFEIKGYNQGEKIFAKIKWSDGGKFSDNSTELTFSGIVNENNEATSEEIYEHAIQETSDENEEVKK